MLVAQKKHHTKLFQATGTGYENVPAGMHHTFSMIHFDCFLIQIFVSFTKTRVHTSGTVVDRGIVHPKNYDFYMCAQAGIIVCKAWGSFIVFYMFPSRVTATKVGLFFMCLYFASLYLKIYLFLPSM